MNSVPNHDFLELHAVHQHQPHCKQQQQCFVFTDIGDIDLSSEITKFPDKLKNGSLHSSYKKDPISSPPKNFKNKKIAAIVGGLLVCIVLAAGIPLGLQLRSSSLLEARLAFIR